MKDNAGIVQQAKFLGLILQMIAVAVIFETRSDHVRASIPAGYGEEDQEYKDAQQRMILTCIFFWFFGLIEFIIIFAGQTLFNQQMNLVLVFAHAASIFQLLSFKRNIGHVDTLSITIVIAGCGPCVLELGSAIMTFMNYRRKDAQHPEA